jgi:7-cyano-7-deazaguanine synthase
MTYEKVLEQTKDIENVGKVVISLSGGLDSTILTYLMVKRFGAENVHALSFDYGQRNARWELAVAKITADKLGIPHTTYDLNFLQQIASKTSGLVSTDIKVDSMEDILGDPQPNSIYVPNRNMLFTSIIAAYAEVHNMDGIALGVTAVDAYSFYDCTMSFYGHLQSALYENRKNAITLIYPLVSSHKEDIIRLGIELGVPFEDTFTCYNPSQEGKPCGVCPACKTRKAGFDKVLAV